MGGSLLLILVIHQLQDPVKATVKSELSEQPLEMTQVYRRQANEKYGLAGKFSKVHSLIFPVENVMLHYFRWTRQKNILAGARYRGEHHVSESFSTAKP